MRAIRGILAGCLFTMVILALLLLAVIAWRKEFGNG